MSEMGIFKCINGCEKWVDEYRDAERCRDCERKLGAYLAALEALRDEVLRQARNADEFTVDWGELSDLAERARKP